MALCRWVPNKSGASGGLGAAPCPILQEAASGTSYWKCRGCKGLSGNRT